MRRRIAVILNFILSGLLLHGTAYGASTSLAAQTTSDSASALRWTTIFETAASLHEFSDPRHTTIAKLTISPALRITERLTLSATGIIEKELEGKQELTARKASLGLRHQPLPISEALKFSPGLSINTPVNETARKEQGFVMGASLVPRILFDLAPMGLAAITGQYEMGLTRNFHRYRTSIQGASNNQYIWTNLFTVDAAIWSKLTVSTSFSYSVLQTYAANRSGQFDISEELSWQFSETTSAAVGHSNGGNSLKANGLDSNINLFDAQNSNVYASISLVL